MSQVQQELTSTTDQLSALSRENELLKERKQASAPAPAHPVRDDPLAEQVQPGSVLINPFPQYVQMMSDIGHYTDSKG